MTLQQLEYVLAVDKYRHFVTAAESCGIKQSTLSVMIKKLEEELDIVIFDRNSHPIIPTQAGEAVIKQAQIVLFNTRQLRELTLSERKRTSGEVNIGITPTIAPYVLPKLFSYFRNHYPEINLHPIELHRKGNTGRLLRAEIDVAIMSMPQKVEGLLEIPLYKEGFVAYISPTDELYKQDSISLRTMPHERIWALKDEICFQHQISAQFPNSEETASNYESGSLITLIHLVDENGGFTVLPELHIPLLSIPRRNHIRPIIDPVPVRRVSMFVRHDYVRESILNAIADGVKTIIPASMIDERIKKYPIRL